MKPGQLIKKLRIQKGLTQVHLANALGYEIPQFISLVENGHSKLPLSILPALIGALCLSKNEIQDLRSALIVEYSKQLDSYLQKKRVKK